MEEKETLLSVIILNIKNHYLMPITLESVFKQTEKSIDILVVTQDILPKELTNLKSYSTKLKIIKMESEVKLSEVKNKAIEKATGKYIHFLFPGEYYLSKYSLQYVFDKIIRKNYPDLLCFSYLHREINSSTKVIHPSFSKSFLGGKRYPLLSRDVIFSKEAIIRVKGFDLRYSGLEGFDLITKIHLEERSKSLCCRRVIVDYELQKEHPKQIIVYVSDLISIIYRQYGFFRLFRWDVIKEIINFWKYWIKGIKRYFMQSEL